MIPDEGAAGPVVDRATHGNRSTLLSQAVRLGCKAASVLVLARLLTPANHGLYAMAASAFLFFFIFRDFGLGAAVVQAAELSAAQLTALFWANTLLGVLFMGVTLATAPLVAQFYASPAAGWLLATMSLAFLFMGLGSLPRTLLARELRFGELNFVETTAAVIGTVVMLVAGATGAGAYTFVNYLLASEALIAALAWRVCRWRPQGRPDWSGLRGIVRTGKNLTGYQALSYVLTQIDTFVIGHTMGTHVLGLYNRAGQLLALSNLHVAGPLTQVGLAAFSRLGQDATQFRQHARATTTMIAHLVLPPLAVCVALPGEIVQIVLGSQWPDAAPMLRWLAISMGILTITSLSYSINVAAGQSRRLTVSVAATLPVTLLAVWLGLPHGAAGVAGALAAANLVVALPRLSLVLAGTPVHIRDYLGALAGPLAVAVALGAGLAAGHALGPDANLPARLLSAGLGGLAGMALLAIVWPRVRAEWREVRTHLPGGGFFTTRPNV